MPAMALSAMRLSATIAHVSGVTLTTGCPAQPSWAAVMPAKAPSAALCSNRNLRQAHRCGCQFPSHSWEQACRNRMPEAPRLYNCLQVHMQFQIEVREVML